MYYWVGILRGICDCRRVVQALRPGSRHATSGVFDLLSTEWREKRISKDGQLSPLFSLMFNFIAIGVGEKGSDVSTSSVQVSSCQATCGWWCVTAEARVSGRAVI